MQLAQTPTKFKLIVTMSIASMSLAGMEGIAYTKMNPDNALAAISMLGIVAIIEVIASCCYYQRAKKEDEINGAGNEKD